MHNRTILFALALLLVAGCSSAHTNQGTTASIKWVNGHPVAAAPSETLLGSAHSPQPDPSAEARPDDLPSSMAAETQPTFAPQLPPEPAPEPVRTTATSADASEKAQTVPSVPQPISPQAQISADSAPSAQAVNTEGAALLPKKQMMPQPLLDSSQPSAKPPTAEPAAAEPAETGHAAMVGWAASKPMLASPESPASSTAPATTPSVVASLQLPKPRETADEKAAGSSEPASFSGQSYEHLQTAGAALLRSLERRPGSNLSDGERALAETSDYSYEEATSWSASVEKYAHVVEVYYKGHLFRTYHAVFGRNPEPGTKRWAGDLRTPEGVYAIVDKYYSPRWKRFLLLNYPNLIDRERYQSLRRQGIVPVVNGHRRSEGDDIGIHGTDRPRFNRENVNWTAGCISVDNDAVRELDRILPIGTVIIIKP